MNFQQIKHIFEGWGKLALDKLNLLPEEEKIKAERKFFLCDTCPMRDNNTCSTKRKLPAIKDFEYNGEQRSKGTLYSGCGCNLQAKILSNAKCPVGNF